MQKTYSVFEGKKIRKTYQNGKWYFCLSDIVYSLTNTSDSKVYLKELRKRRLDIKENWHSLCPLYLINTNGGNQKVKCVDYDSIIIIFKNCRSVKKEKFFKWVKRVSKQKND